ncbi:TrbG/VirB9 family P-type conjugative transfer protein [Paraburkholderia ginsengiterrae]|uniref:TrbG/VirB9 family P-type conjugative transfer protein n=1 Tax=Paraburkholderia ginsengiterrae TaxID=1462993 RepID=UPI0009EE3405|nr:TrbG/VirB9 family P-type conjugative transfer protein [Paraburkholderia ginsengiterrae]
MRTVRSALTAVVVAMALSGVAHAVIAADPVLRGTEGTVQRLPYVPDQIYDLTVADRTLLAIDFPTGEHIKAVAQSTAPVFHVQRTGDTLQVTADKPGETMGLNVTTTRGTYHLQIASIADALTAAHIVHFVTPSAY